MSDQKTTLSLPVQLALFGVFILNLAIGIVHLLAALVSEQFPLWTILPILTAILTIFMSWQILQLVDSHHVNFGFQLGGLWLVTTAVVDFFLYILPAQGSVTDRFAELANELLVHYLVILAAPTVIGIIQYVRVSKGK